MTSAFKKTCGGRNQVSFDILIIPVHLNWSEFFNLPGIKVLAPLTFYFESQLHENMVTKRVVSSQLSQYSQTFFLSYDTTEQLWLKMSWHKWGSKLRKDVLPSSDFSHKSNSNSWKLHSKEDSTTTCHER